MSGNGPRIEIDRATKLFKSGAEIVTALNEVSLKVFSGEVLGIIGPSGSGKSTLLNVLGLIDLPTSGQVYLNGQGVPQADNQRAMLRCTEIGFVFQHFNLLPGLTATENVMIPALLADVPRSRAKDMARALLGELSLSSREMHYPCALSGGEMQRVAIARALINSPKILIADEPTGSLDSNTGAAVVSLLTKNKKIAVIIATHSESVIRACTRVLHLKDGRIDDK
jgi:ABC-type lipoprotein export system ATPase subunit